MLFPSNSFKSGFSLIEMLVVLGIFTIITGVVLADLPSFRDQTNLELVAEEIAVTIRQAQAYGVGTRASAAAFPSHGIYFAAPATDPKNMVLFADGGPTPNNKYDGDLSGEAVERYNLQGSVSIVAIFNCSTGTCLAYNEALNIIYQRPNLDAVFKKSDGSTPSGGATIFKIILQSARDSQKRCRAVTVFSTGQISTSTYVDEPFCQN